MRASLILVSTVLLGGCLDAGTSGTDAAFRGTLRVEVTPLNLAGAQSVLFDVGAGPDAEDIDWSRGRVEWTGGEEPAVFVAPCDVRDAPHRVEVHAVGAYEARPSALGEFGAIVPDGGIDYQDPGVLEQVAVCVAAQETPVKFDVALMRPAQQGFLDTAVFAHAGEVGDAVWDLQVVNSDTPPVPVWQQRITSSEYGDSVGNASYVGPCDANLSANAFRVRLVGLFTEDAEHQSRFDAPGPEGAIAIWPPSIIDRGFTCFEDKDVFAQVDITVARVDRASGGVRARIGEAVCEASWTCADTSTLELACTSASDIAPTLHLDDLVVRCDGAEVARVDPSAVGTVSFERFVAGGSEARWKVAPALDPTLFGERSCVLEAAGTVDLPAPREPPEHRPGEPDPVFQRAYPRISWTIPVHDANGARCEDAALDVGGPITITYTSDDAVAGTFYTHSAAPPISR